MPPSARKLLLAAHIATSVGWIGALAAYLALDVTVATSADPARLRSAYLAMHLLVTSVIVPLGWASLVGGIVLSLGTPWGLFRHYWVIVSLILTVVALLVLLVEAQTVAALARIAVDPQTTDDALRALPSTLVHSVGGMVVLLLVLGLNVFKPRGLTRYGWRKERDGRAR